MVQISGSKNHGMMSQNKMHTSISRSDMNIHESRNIDVFLDID